MAYINFSERKKVKIFEGITAQLFHSDQMTFAYVTLQQGADVLEHCHVLEQWANAIEEEMMFVVNDEKKLLTTGMTAFIPSNVIHSAKAITLCKAIDCFLPIREDFIELEKQQ